MEIKSEVSGISSCLADIGTHAFNMLELVCGMKVKKILADLNNLYEDNPLDIDVSVLVRMENGCKGTIRSTQIATGLENNLNISVYGSKGSLLGSKKTLTIYIIILMINLYRF